MSDKPDYRDTVFLPKTDFPMKAGLAQKEPAILARWAEEKLYEQLRAARKGRKRFILHDGPPYANGDIHMGHAMNKILKDIVVRSATLRGFDAPYIPGWDCHGLPIEWKVEEAYRKQKQDKDEVPVDQFRAECRAYADKWVAVQAGQFQRLGVMGEWDDPYLTMKHEAEAKIVAELLKFAESGQLYRGAKPVMWSPVEKTALAEAEVEYEDITSTQIDVGFEIVESPIPELVGAYAVVWTTTPWTIPVNQAIAYGPEIDYVIIGYGERRLLMAEERLFSFWFRQANQDQASVPPHVTPGDDIRWRGKGAELAGTVARHPMWRLDNPPRDGEGDREAVEGGLRAHGVPEEPPPSAAGAAATSPSRGGFFSKPRPFLPGEFVTTDQGTGLVHMAPDHGEDDFELCKSYGIDPVFAVEGDGKYRADWAWLGGQGSVINAKFNAPDGPICTDLREAGALLAASADFQHSYPHSWRSKAKVIFRCTPQWFIPMDRSAASGLPGAGRSAEMGSQSEPRRDGGDPLPRLSSPLVREVREGGADLRSARDDIAHPHPQPPPHKGEGDSSPVTNGPTLRGVALDAIENTRWVPEKSKNRIRAMVEGRPDWVISRQRAWGVPIALYVNRKSGEYLNDPAVNARIVAAFEAGGADAWFTADHQILLGPDYRLADYEPVNDILDVWFDSGSTHAFVIEARYGEGVRADLYVEGSDQHRGWFQSSLLESSGTRGRAPYDAVLTHGFALDGNGRKMSKSLGNVVDPLAIIRDNGADILRLWVASTDYFEDVRIGKEVLAGTSDAYRKLRNTFRYLLGALDGFTDAERLPVAEMPELERWVLHRLAMLDAEFKDAAEGFEFNRYVRALQGFANDDLSAFFFDIRKDSLYCDAPSATKRRAYRTVLDTVFEALVRWAAPILCFTAEEVWQTRYPEGGSVHLLDWPEIDATWRDDDLGARWTIVRRVRESMNEAIEYLRRHKYVGSSLAADIWVQTPNQDVLKALESIDLSEVGICGSVAVGENGWDHGGLSMVSDDDGIGPTILINADPTKFHKCGRCWRHLPEVVEDGDLCGRCEEVVNG